MELAGKLRVMGFEISILINYPVVFFLYIIYGALTRQSGSRKSDLPFNLYASSPPLYSSHLSFFMTQKTAISTDYDLQPRIRWPAEFSPLGFVICV